MKITPSASIDKLKIYGERNTGTNYLCRLIETNLQVKLLRGTAPPALRHLRRFFANDEHLIDTYFRWSYPFNLGWKHSAPRPLTEITPYPGYRSLSGVIFLVRNPYSWLLSLHKNPYHQTHADAPGFDQFLNRIWQMHRRDEIVGAPLNPIQLWNRKIRSYLEFAERRKILIRFEDLLEDPKRSISHIAQKFEIQPTDCWFTNIEASTKGSGKDYDGYRAYYRTESWKKNLSADSIRRINKDLDEDLLQALGYTRLTG